MKTSYSITYKPPPALGLNWVSHSSHLFSSIYIYYISSWFEWIYNFTIMVEKEITVFPHQDYTISLNFTHKLQCQQAQEQGWYCYYRTLLGRRTWTSLFHCCHIHHVKEKEKEKIRLISISWGEQYVPLLCFVNHDFVIIYIPTCLLAFQILFRNGEKTYELVGNFCVFYSNFFKCTR